MVQRGFWPRGKVLGGCSSINGMVYIRGSRHDYDNWAKEGAKGWSYKDVLPYFKKSEDVRIDELKNSGTLNNLLGWYHYGMVDQLNVQESKLNTYVKAFKYTVPHKLRTVQVYAVCSLVFPVLPLSFSLLLLPLHISLCLWTKVLAKYTCLQRRTMDLETVFNTPLGSLSF